GGGGAPAGSRGGRMQVAEKPQAPLARRNVLVDVEEVVGVVAPLELLEAGVLSGAVRLADTVLTLVAEEVDVDACLVRLQGVPEIPHPLPLFVEAVGALGAGADVVGEG